jgi:hypothetical protein
MTDAEMHERLHKFRERHYTAQERGNSSQFPSVICGPWILYLFIAFFHILHVVVIFIFEAKG